MTYFDFALAAVCLGVLLIIIFIHWIPVRAHVFGRQCCKRFMTIFTGWTVVSWTEKYGNGTIDRTTPIPNYLIIGCYLFCCMMAIDLLR